MSEEEVLRREYYQTQSHVNVSLFVKGCTEKEVEVKWSANKVEVVIFKQGSRERVIPLNLCASIVPSQCTFKVFPSKIELKMEKAIASTWSSLEKVKNDVDSPNVSTTRDSKLASSKWDSIARELQEEDDGLEGDAALQNFFRNIYAGADEDTRRAMNKSFMESNGTVLSTNWSDICKEKVQPRLSSDKEVKHLDQ